MTVKFCRIPNLFLLVSLSYRIPVQM
jgi:hypothetical protein